MNANKKYFFLLYNINISEGIFLSKSLLICNYKFPNIECEDWGKGLNNTSIDNNNEKYGCQIRLPKYCQYKLFSSFQDYTKILGVNCS